MIILVTGAAGFIGMHLVRRLVKDGYQVVGVDNLNDYYDPQLKNNRLNEVKMNENFTFIKADIADRRDIEDLFKKNDFTHVINLAAQAGVRYSLDNPHLYVDTNIVGFTNLLESCRKYHVKHFMYASSSSVYGANTKIPFSTKDAVNHPISLYAATKKSNELMAHTYSHLFGIPTTGLRFFTVYGPWGRPDMAYFSFTKDILAGQTLRVFNYGDMKRDFTYIDDVVEGIIQLINKVPQENPTWNRGNPDPSSSYAPYRIYNIGNNQPVKLMDFIKVLEGLLNKKASIEFLPMQPGDVQVTYADIDDLKEAVGFSPSTPIEVGLSEFVKWYQWYYQ